MMDMRNTYSMTLNYQPNVWDRIGGPWAITLRAYLWCIPLGVLLQPLVEPGFWSGNENPFAWYAVSAIAYLVAGAFLYLANRFVIPNREIKPAPGVLMLGIGMLAGVTRSIAMGTLIPIFGLTGITAVERLPFGSIIGIFWIISSALVMDSKYRYRRQLAELIAEQKSALEIQKQHISKFAEVIPETSNTELDTLIHGLQKVFRDLAVKASVSTSNWVVIAGQLYRSITGIILVTRQSNRVSDLRDSDLVTSRKDAFQVISRTPLFHIPAVISIYSTTIAFATARILPIDLAGPKLAFGLLINWIILGSFKWAIKRGKGDSSFGYLAMFTVLILLAIIGPEFYQGAYVTRLQLQIFTIAGTFVEIIWIHSTGLLMLSQLNRQKIINQATEENEQLRSEIQYWKTIEGRVVAAKYSPITALDLVASDLRQYITSDQPMQSQGAIEFTASLIKEIKLIRNANEEFSLAVEFARIQSNWASETDILWTSNGLVPDADLGRIAIQVVEISILRSTRIGHASLVSIDLTSGADEIKLSVSDNGVPQGESGAAMGNVMLSELTNGSYTSTRSGALTIATATIS
jgi:hypothetical protein